VHRDIKPENIMVARQESGGLRVRVMDFGLARASDVTRITKTGMMVGTMSYVSPEQVAGKAVDTRSDLYSLGTVLYECVSGEVPFTGEMQSVLYRVVHEFPQSPRERGIDIDAELEKLILSCLAKDPDERPARASDLAKGLRLYRARMQEDDRQRSVMITRSVHAPRPTMAPFVDRQEEFKELQGRLNAAVAGECQFAVVAGVMGVGKTRLLDELENLAGARSIRVLHGRFIEQDGAFPYHGFCEAIQEYFRQREAGSHSSGGESPDFSDLSADLIALFPVLSEIETFRAISTGSAPRAAAGESRTPENRNEIFELLARTFIRLAAGKPLVLLLEELHGAEVSVEALQYIVRRLGPTPTLMVGTYRPNEVERGHALSRMLEGFRGDRRFTAITLQPFGREDHRTFLGTLIGGTQFGEDLAQRLYESTEGNAFFTKELVRSLLDTGNIAQDDTGAWTLSGSMDFSSGALPATIQEAVEKRIGRLPDDMRAVLAIAAVMGKTFDFRDLEKLAKDQDDLEDLIDRLIQEGLIEEERQSRGDTLVFTSGVVREVLYAELSRRKRRALHRKFATHLEKRHAGKMERILARLVYHFAEGDEPEKTVAYGLQHARRSLETFSPEEAARSAKTALEFLDEEWEGDAVVEGEARTLLAAAHRMAGDTDGALREIAAAVKVFEREGKPEAAVDALLEAARSSWQARRPGETRAWVERGLEAARAAGAEEKLASFLALAATLANLRGEYDKAAEFQTEAEQLEQKTAEGDTGMTPASGGILTVGLVNPVAVHEPAVMETVEEWEVFTNVFETLLTTDADGNLAPVLCEKWEGSEDGRTFILRLASDVSFADGSPLNATAVKEAFQHSLRRAGERAAPALATLAGGAAFLAGTADEVSGLTPRGEHTLEVNLDASLPIYPALLTDARTGIFHRPDGVTDGQTRSSDGPYLVGTGPFAIASFAHDEVRLIRNDGWRGTATHVDEVIFRCGLTPAAIADGLETGDLDIGGDRPPATMDRLLREPRFRHGLEETPRSSTYFVIFNTTAGSAVKDERIRRVLTQLLRPQDLVWQTLGRFAEPATGLLPPGMLGHDPGRRRTFLSVDEARERLAAAGAGDGLSLQAAVHPVIRERHGALLETILSAWDQVGVKVSLKNADMDTYLKCWNDNKDIDLNIARWAADYNDPDNFAHSLFHSHGGLLSSYFSSDETDKLVTSARGEPRAAVRERLYHEFENCIFETGALVPLFHEVDTRLAAPALRNFKLRSGYPAINYAELWKCPDDVLEAEAAHAPGGALRIPMAAKVVSVDPALSNRLEEGECIAGVYETLTRFLGARIEPWLAEEITAEENGRRYRIRLRSDVRFHDGRRLNARDVRHSFERLLLSEKSERRGLFAPIVGARNILDTGSGELTGFHIHSALEFTIELETPLVFFPFLITDPAIAILPEGTGAIGNSMAEGAIGTGPFQVSAFEPGRQLEMVRNPHYRRKSIPRSDSLVFDFGISPQAIASGFKEGRYSLAVDLNPSDVEALRRDAAFGAGYVEASSLSTYYMAFNVNREPGNDPDTRRQIAASLDLARLVRQTLGTRGVHAQSWIPPGLLEHEATSGSAPRAGAGSSLNLELTAAVHPILQGEHGTFFRGLVAMLKDAGVRLKTVTKTMDEFIQASQTASVDVELGRWYADFPDADDFAHCLHSTREGALGQMCGMNEIDALIAEGRAHTDPATRQATYRRLEAFIAREVPMIPLFHEQVYRIAHPDVDGLTVSDWQPIVNYETLRTRGR
jgi:ABC-type transport system substrate-binding protein